MCHYHVREDDEKKRAREKCANEEIYVEVSRNRWDIYFLRRQSYSNNPQMLMRIRLKNVSIPMRVKEYN